MSGNVIWRTICHGEAPSTRAACSISFGILSIAAWNMIIANAIPRQMLMMMIESSGALCSQSTGEMPSSARPRLRVPNCPSASMLPHASAATTSGTTMGRRIAAPNRPLNRIDVRLSKMAAIMPSTNWPTIAEKNTNSAEIPSDCKNPPSVNSVR
jgi:hypothetical protein